MLHRFAHSSASAPLRHLANCVLPKQPVIVPLLPPLAGHRMRVDIQSQKAYVLGTYEPEVCKALIGRVKPGQIVADVGAHIGYMTLLLARLVGPSGHVFAFEPVPPNFNVLSENVYLNGYRQVTLEPKAVINRNGLVTLFVPRQCYTSQASLFGDSGEACAVEAVSLDAYWECRGDLPLHLVKMDIEGGEDLAVQGMQRILQEHRPIVMIEIHALSDGQALTLLREHGYRLHSLDTRGWSEVDATSRGHILAEYNE